MQIIKLKAETRSATGKGAARQLRAKGLVPAVFYGRATDTFPLAISPKELQEAIAGEMGINTLLELDVGGKSVKTMLTDYQLHPVTRNVLHADFLKVDDDRAVDVEVPLEFVGKAKGIVMGGKLRQVFLKVPVRCLPGNIPARISFDVSELEIDSIVRARDLATPEGVEVRLKPAQTLGGVYGSRRGSKPGEDGEDDAAATK